METRALSFEGVYPPVLTPFRGDEVAYDKLAANLQRLHQYPLTGYVMLGSTGEFPLLSESEKERVLATAREATPRPRLVIAGTGGESTPAAIRLSRRAADLGADAVLIITPSYYKGMMKPPVLIRHYRAIADACPVPVFLYNFPANTGINLEPDTVARLAEHPNIRGIKDSSGNVPQAAETMRLTPKTFQVVVGSPLAFLPALVLGAAGGILAVANVAPHECCEIWRLAQAGQWTDAREIVYRISPLATGIGARYGIGGLKAALDLLGYYGGPTRGPLPVPDGDAVEEIKEILATAGLL
ncbi:MAG TPA: dihydrodipicolinate synthase family protein [Methylomirabilota bacterium]|jgi:4-hydroxy-2-oxoglutarate aldolase|nr:dihydrodipicolinate synthase family protein [Methylomirabilota bacterium]